jgi:hypothetical protein
MSSNETAALLVVLVGCLMAALVFYGTLRTNPSPAASARLSSFRLRGLLAEFAAEMDFRLSSLKNQRVPDQVMSAALVRAFGRDYAKSKEMTAFRTGELKALVGRLRSAVGDMTSLAPLQAA